MTNKILVSIGGVASSVGRAVAAEEKLYFPEAPELFAEAPESQLFIFLGVYVDGELAHALRLSTTDGSEDSVPFFVWDLCRSNAGVSNAEISEALATSGARASECASVETNFRVKRFKGFRGGPIAYGVISHLRESLGCADGVLAHLNRAARISFAQVGIVAEQPFAEKFGTPAVDGGIDLRYVPSLIRTTESNNAALDGLFRSRPIAIEAEDLPRVDQGSPIRLDEEVKVEQLP